MRIGVFYFPADYGIRPDELGRELESRGFESLFMCEHTHIPVSRRSPYPGGGDLPGKYAHTHDPFVALSLSVAATQKLVVGTGICLVTEHDPIVAAKSIASLDMLSEGRFVFGIGAGWNAEEMENHGTRFETRFQVMRERVLAIAGQPFNLEIGLGGEQGSQRFPQHSMIVSNHNPDFWRRRAFGNHNEFLDAIQSSCV